MNASTRYTLLAGLLLCLVLSATTVAGGEQTTAAPSEPAKEEPEEEAADPKPTLSVESLQKQIEEIKGREGLEEERKKELLDAYEGALANLRKANEAAAAAASYAKQASEAPTLLEKMKKDLSTQPEEPEVEIPADATLAQLEQKLAAAEAELQAATNKAAALDEESKQRAEKRQQIPKQLAIAREELAEVEQKLAAEAPAEGAAETMDAQRAVLLTRQKMLKNQIEQYEAQLRSYDATNELLAARKDLAASRISLAKKRVAALQETVNERRRQEAEKAAREAEKTRREAAQAHPALKELAETNAALAERRTGPDGLTSKVETVAKQLESTDSKLKELKSDFESVEGKVGAAGLSKAIGLLLLKKRGELPDVRDYRRQIKKRQPKISSAQFELLQLEEQRADLSDLEAAVEEAMAQVGSSVTEQKREDIRAEAQKLLETRRELLDALIGDYNAYFSKLVDLDLKQQELVEQAEQYGDYIDERILWVQSTSPIGREAIGSGWEAGIWLTAPGHWTELGQTLLKDFRTNPGLIAGALLILVLLIIYRYKAPGHLKTLGDRVRKARSDSFIYTLEATLITAVAAAAWPALIGFVGWRLGTQLGASEAVQAAAAGLRRVAGAYLVLEFIRTSCWPSGLTEDHFRVREKPLNALRKHLHWLILIVLPAIFVIATLRWQSEQLHAETLGRFVFMIGMLAVSAFALIVLRPKGPVLEQTFKRRQEGMVYRLRYVWYCLAVAFPLSLVALAAFGYYYTAQQLEARLEWSILLGLGAWLLNGLVVRWLMVARRRLAIQKLEERRQKQKAEAEEKEKAGPEGQAEETVPQPPEPEESIYAMNRQSQRFLHAFVAFAVLLGLWFIWSGVLPALAALDNIVLWRVTAAAEGAAGAEGLVETQIPITVADLALSLIMAVVTVAAARNIPGLMEILVLRHLPIDRGIKFAAKTISRYVIVVTGVALAFSQLGVGWSKIQWLVAAMTVGLGFGLQEIFANFISGLIILFERPMRVGDTVAVGDVLGTVTQIRIRATTILKWDNKELIVPNKEFITGRLTNWTLSNSVIRMEFPVGIAYGSDTDRAESELLKIAKKHPLILQDPAPRVIFKGFGDSTLNFELRVFIPDLDSYAAIWHGVNKSIDNAFREADVEIAFPQQDIHVRSVEAPFPIRSLHDEDHPGPSGKSAE